MSRRKRLRRKDPARTAPIRRFSTLLRPNGDSAPDAATSRATADDTVAHAVRMGYSVVEEQIQRGQRAAQQLGGGLGLGALPNEPGAMVNRLLRYSTDLMALYFDLVGMLSQRSMPNAAGLGGRPTSTAAPDVSTASKRERGARVVIEISSARKNQVTVDLWIDAPSARLAVPALHSIDAEKPPLTSVEFLPAAGSEPARLRIAIPDAQPADVYTGLIVDTETRESRGTLTLRLYE